MFPPANLILSSIFMSFHGYLLARFSECCSVKNIFRTYRMTNSNPLFNMSYSLVLLGVYATSVNETGKDGLIVCRQTNVESKLI